MPQEDNIGSVYKIPDVDVSDPVKLDKLKEVAPGKHDTHYYAVDHSTLLGRIVKGIAQTAAGQNKAGTIIAQLETAAAMMIPVLRPVRDITGAVGKMLKSNQKITIQHVLAVLMAAGAGYVGHITSNQHTMFNFNVLTVIVTVAGMLITHVLNQIKFGKQTQFVKTDVNNLLKKLEKAVSKGSPKNEHLTKEEINDILKSAVADAEHIGKYLLGKYL